MVMHTRAACQARANTEPAAVMDDPSGGVWRRGGNCTRGRLHPLVVAVAVAVACAVIVIAVPGASAHSAACGSSQLRVHHERPSPQAYADPGWDVGADGQRVRRRRLSPAAWGNMRVTAHYNNVGGTYSAEEQYVQSTVFPSAMALLEASLRVNNVGGNLKMSRPCATYWIANGVCASFRSPVMCGTNAVPDDYIGATQVCTGGPTTSCSTSPGGDGVPDTDFLVFVTTQQTSTCGSSTLACTWHPHVWIARVAVRCRSCGEGGMVDGRVCTLCVTLACRPFPGVSYSDAASCAQDQFDRYARPRVWPARRSAVLPSHHARVRCASLGATDPHTRTSTSARTGWT